MILGKGDLYDFSNEIIHHAEILIRFSKTVLEKKGKPTILQSPLYHRVTYFTRVTCIRTPFIARVKYVLTWCGHSLTVSGGRVKQRKLGGGGLHTLPC